MDGKIPGWAWIVVVIVGLYLVIGKLTSSANSVIKQVGATKAATAQSFANTGVGVFASLGETIGSFFGGSKSGASTTTVSAPPSSVGSSAFAPDQDVIGGSIEGELAACDAGGDCTFG